MRLLAICALALVFGYIGSMPLAGPVAIMALSRAARRKFGEALRVGLGAAVAEGLYEMCIRDRSTLAAGTSSRTRLDSSSCRRCREPGVVDGGQGQKDLAGR